MNPLLYPILIPILLGVICWIIPRNVKVIREFLAFVGSAGTFGLILWLFGQKPLEFIFQEALLFRLDNLSGFILLAIGFFGFLVTIYSIKFMQDKEHNNMFYGSLLWTLGAACGAILANHLILLLIFWGFLGITLYFLILTGGSESAPAAKKSLIIIGGSDALILLGIVLVYSLTSTFEMDKIFLSLENIETYFIFILFALGVFAKIGAIPLHTWIPDVAEKAPVSTTAFLPGSLDKLLGIYLLARVSLNFIEVSKALNLILLIIGALTVLISVMMGLVQNDSKKLMGYLIITGAGYMVLGIGTGNPIGISGGLFYMLSSAVWTSCLFLAIGSVEYRTGESMLDKLGGLVRFMPLTFLVSLIAILSIAGIPPFNGFYSKWMIYQGLINMGMAGDKLWIIWLIIAMFGSALTLAVGAKFIHSVFLGIPSKGIQEGKIREVGFFMSVPMLLLSLLCILFGIFATQLPLKKLILPCIPDVTYFGSWAPGLATILILVGLGVGFMIYLMGNLKNVREADHFVGGEKLPIEERVTGTGFYNTVHELKGLRWMYSLAEAKSLDIYDQLMHLSLNISGLFRRFHNGILTTYLVWIIIGILILLIVLMGGLL